VYTGKNLGTNFSTALWALLTPGFAFHSMFTFPKGLLALTLFAALAVMPTGVLRAQWVILIKII
jgi:hypothetical protein